MTSLFNINLLFGIRIMDILAIFSGGIGVKQPHLRKVRNAI